MAATILQHKGTYFGSITTGSITLPNPTFGGDLLVALVYYNTTSSISVSDPQNGTYSVCPSGAGVTWPQSGLANGFQFANCFFVNNIAGSGSTTTTLNLGSNTFAEMEVVEMSLQDSTTPIDKTAFGTGTSGSASSGSVTTTLPDLVLGFFQGSGNPTWTPTSGFSTLETLNSTHSLVSSITQGSAGAVAATATAASNTWGAMLVAIKGTTATLNSITVTPSPGSVTVPNTLQMTAIGAYSDGTNRNITPIVTWSSSNTGSATISSGGLVTAIAAGTATITATLGTNGTSTLTVHPQVYDQYGGILAVPCTNNNTAFSLTTVNILGHGNQVLFCTPAGHGMFSRGFYGMDITLNQSPDESGTTGAQFDATKYGSDNIALQQEVIEVASWGMNTLPPFEHNNQKAPASPTLKLPYVQLLLSSEYALGRAQQLGWATASTHDLMYYLKGTDGAGPSNWNGQKPSGMAEWGDPVYLSVINGIFANDGGITALAASSAANKAYVLGFSQDESDGTHCLGAGPDFATSPSGNNDYSCGYVSFFVPPTSWANPHQAQIYPSGLIYLKQQWQALVIAKYGSTPGTAGGTSGTALNTAWGSSYTTINSSGVCVGTQPSGITCATTVASPDMIGTGDGTTLTFSSTLSHTTVSGYSLGIFVNGVLVGGDTGAGALYGPNLTGTINYSTGAITTTFSATHAPVNTATITAVYMANAWGIGTGFMDEDCRSGHSAYCGNGSNNTTIYFCSTPPSTGCLPANVQTDLNAMTVSWTTQYASVFTGALAAWAAANGFTGTPVNIGPTTTGTWGTPSSRYVLQGLQAGGQQAYSYGGEGQFTQAELDFVNLYAPGLPLIAGSYRTANADSAMAWKNTSCSHSGSTVTCTVATPNTFGTGSFLDITCVDTTYNQIGFHPTSVTGGGTTLVYTATGGPTSASTTCTLFWDDANVGGFPTLAARAADFQSKITALATTQYTTSGLFPYVGYYWWSLTDTYSGDPLNWGVKSNRDNAYDGNENITSTTPCQPPLASFGCGGELRSGQGGSTVAAIIATNAAIDAALTPSLAPSCCSPGYLWC